MPPLKSKFTGELDTAHVPEESVAEAARIYALAVMTAEGTKRDCDELAERLQAASFRRDKALAELNAAGTLLSEVARHKGGA